MPEMYEKAREKAAAPKSSDWLFRRDSFVTACRSQSWLDCVSSGRTMSTAKPQPRSSNRHLPKRLALFPHASNMSNGFPLEFFMKLFELEGLEHLVTALVYYRYDRQTRFRLENHQLFRHQQSRATLLYRGKGLISPSSSKVGSWQPRLKEER